MTQDVKFKIFSLYLLSILLFIFYFFSVSYGQKSIFINGFIGIDIIFFLIGFVVTWQIYYEKKIKKIFKYIYDFFVILLLLIIFFSIFAFFYFLPLDLKNFSESFLYSIIILSNFYYHFAGLEHWAFQTKFHPLYLTFAISIIFQYLILFLIFYKITKTLSKRKIIFLIFILTILSFGLSDWGTENIPRFKFYFIGTRFWEFGVGSLVFFIYDKINIHKISENISLGLALFGIFTLFVCSIFFISNTYHPKAETIVPLIGSGLFLIFFRNSPKNFTIKKEYYLLIFIFLFLSYFFVVMKTRLELFSNDLNNLSIIGSALLISTIILLFFNKFKTSLKNIKIVFSLFLFLIIFHIYSIQNFGYQYRIPQSMLKNLTINHPWLNLKANNQNCYNRIESNCFFNLKEHNNIIAVGDSFIGSLIFDLNKRASINELGFIPLALDGCWLLSDHEKFSIKKQKMTECNASYQKKRIDIINSTKDNIIILGGRLPVYLSGKLFNNEKGGIEGDGKWNFEFIETQYSKQKNNQNSLEKDIKNTIISILNNNHKIVLIYPFPEVGWSVPQKLINISHINFFKKNDDKYQFKNFIVTDYQLYKKRTAKTFAILDDLKHKNLYRVYPHKLVCNTLIANKCVGNDKKNIYYYDDDHPSLFSVKLINDEIFEIINFMLKKY
tara:strand:+ start:1932 stop:3935 length:2004 start_codon:yes stop_codon:yes gene_type:complete